MERITGDVAPVSVLRITVVGALLGAAATMSPPSASASPDKVTICHATGSESNPYVQITVSESAVREGKGHNRDGHQHGEDIIPPGPYDADGLNWDADSQAIYDEGCLSFLPNVLPPSR